MAVTLTFFFEWNQKLSEIIELKLQTVEIISRSVILIN